MTENSGEPSNYHKWLRTLYVETWKQYQHEDNVSQSRNTLFLGVQTALLATLAAVTGSFVKIDPITVVWGDLHIGFVLVGIFATLFCFLGLGLCDQWGAANRAGYAFLKLRWAVAAAIEHAAGLKELNLAGLENRWHQYSDDAEDKLKHFVPFPDIEALANIELDQKEETGGWLATGGFIKILRKLWYFLLLGAIVSISLPILALL